MKNRNVYSPREITPYVIGAIAGAVTPIVAARYIVFAGDASDISELNRWLLAVVPCVLPLKGHCREWPTNTISFYGALAGASLVSAISVMRSVKDREKEQQNAERLRYISLDSSLL